MDWSTPNRMDSMDARSDEALERAKLKGGCRNLKDIVPRTSMSSSVASLARMSRTPGSVPVWTGPGAGCGLSSHDWLASYDHGQWLSRTSLVYSPAESLPFSGTWPRSGTIRNGRLYAHRMLARRTAGSGCSSWPTLRANPAMSAGITPESVAQKKFPNLEREVGRELWTTPCVRDKETLAKVTRGAGSQAAGQEMVEPLLVQAAKDWPTPAARDTRSESCSQAFALKRNAQTRGKPLTWEAQRWSTPCCEDKEAAGSAKRGGLTNDVRLAGLPAPARRNTRGSQAESSPHPVVLNPRWVSCLMGFPPDYLDGVEVPSKR